MLKYLHGDSVWCLCWHTGTTLCLHFGTCSIYTHTRTHACTQNLLSSLRVHTGVPFVNGSSWFLSALSLHNGLCGVQSQLGDMCMYFSAHNELKTTTTGPFSLNSYYDEIMSLQLSGIWGLRGITTTINHMWESLKGCWWLWVQLRQEERCRGKWDKMEKMMRREMLQKCSNISGSIKRTNPGW